MCSTQFDIYFTRVGRKRSLDDLANQEVNFALKDVNKQP